MYCEAIDLGTQSSAARSYLYAANGLYDPNISGTGHQPMGFDQMMTFYNHYCVLKATIKVQYSSEITTPQYEIHAGLGVTRASSPSTNWSLVCEEGNLIEGLIGGVSAGGGMPSPPFVNSVDIGKFQSVTYPLDDDTLKGTASANPSSLVYFVIYTSAPFAPGSSTDHVYANVTLEFDAVFSEPIPLAQSFSTLKKKAGEAVATDFETGGAVLVHMAAEDGKSGGPVPPIHRCCARHA